ncbi:MAG: HAMP domain-containing protein [Spartobacteria bacterium]|nr:HAMP domain-containing protein [Spartobacteria bacterium]
MNKFFTQRRITLVSAVVLYAVANYLSGKKYLPGCSFAELRPQICLPIFMGLYFGPVYGFITGAGGDGMGYLLAGINPLPLWDWSLANGLVGLIAGCVQRVQPRRITSLKGLQTLYMFLLLSTSVPFLFPSAMVVFSGSMSLKETFQRLFLPIFVTDALFAIMIIPVCLLVSGLLTRTISTAIFLMTTYLTSMVALGTFAACMVTVWGRNALSSLAASHLYTIGVLALLIILCGFALASHLVRRITRPLLALAQTADHISDEKYEEAENLKTLESRSDELGKLASAFRQMAAKVKIREATLKAEVRQLHIQIDRSKQKREVSKITGSDYFKTLKNKAAELRIKDTSS